MSYCDVLPDFAQEEVYVEDTNFESTTQRLKSSHPTCLTFLFMQITGRISAAQLRVLLTIPKSIPAIKLVN